MSHYGAASLAKLETCHEELVAVCSAVIPFFDNTVIWGARGEVAQTQAFDLGFSLTRWPNSLHNVAPPKLSDAIDLAPWYASRPHIRWGNEREFVYLAGHMMMAAASLGVGLRWGGDWDRDKDLHDRNKPFDLGHFERIT
jgi:hypothetical protein